MILGIKQATLNGGAGSFPQFFFAIKRVVLVGALIALWKDNVSTNYVADCRCTACEAQLLSTAFCLLFSLVNSWNVVSLKKRRQKAVCLVLNVLSIKYVFFLQMGELQVSLGVLNRVKSHERPWIFEYCMCVSTLPGVRFSKSLVNPEEFKNAPRHCVDGA